MSEQRVEEMEHDEEREPEGPSAEERRAWRAAALSLVRQFPDPALRNPAAPVGDVDQEVRELVARMTDIMSSTHGVGLAAPQVGVLRRVLVYRAGEEDVRVLINPELVDTSEEMVVDTEGCLSLLGGELSVPIERHESIRVTGLDGDGASVEYHAEGFEARVIQHEVDHLNGVLIVDRADGEERRSAMRELRLRAG